MDCFARRESAAEKGLASVDVERIEAIVDEFVKQLRLNSCILTDENQCKT